MPRKRKSKGLGGLSKALDGFGKKVKKGRKKSLFSSALDTAWKPRKRKINKIPGESMAAKSGWVNRRKRKLRNKMEDAMSGALGSNRLTKGAANSRMVKQAASFFATKLSRTEYADEQQRVIDDLENNPQRFAEEVRRNRLAAQLPWVRRIATWLARAAGRNLDGSMDTTTSTDKGFGKK